MPTPLSPLYALGAYGVVLGTVVILGELAARVRGSGSSRSSVHMAVGVSAAMSPWISAEQWPMLLLAVAFVLANGGAMAVGTLDGIHGGRDSLGTVWFPAAFFAVVLLWWQSPAILCTSMLVLALADPAGARVGGDLDTPSFTWWADAKTLGGSTAVGVVAAIVTATVFTLTGQPHPLLAALTTGVVAILCEGPSKGGSDNLSIVLGVASWLTVLRAAPAQSTLGLLAAVGIGLTCWRLGLLTSGGGAGAALVGGLLFGAAGWAGAVALLGFFILSSALSKIAERVRPATHTDDKGSTRDWIQVMANGGVAAGCAVASLAHPAGLAALVGTLAAANADTWATEIGRLGDQTPRSLLSRQPVAKGESGGVTPVGTLGSIAGSAALVLLTAPLLPASLQEPRALLLLILAGAVAAAFDSVLGETLQARYATPTGITERAPDDARAACVKGVWWMTNDTVNLLATLAGALLGAAAVMV